MNEKEAKEIIKLIGGEKQEWREGIRVFHFETHYIDFGM